MSTGNGHVDLSAGYATRRVESVNVVTAEIIRNALTAAALEMNKTLVRTAYNPLLYEVQDFGLGIISSTGELWAEAPGVMVFLGCLPDTIASGLAIHGADGFAEGDVLIANDPYLTGTHISDTSVYIPAFYEGELIAFAIATAHWADIGGMTPGGWCPNSTDVYQEGLAFSHQKLVAAGTRNEDLWRFIENNVRYPALVRGDLDAQIAACRQGVLRIQALCRKYGAGTVRQAMDFAVARTDVAIRKQISEIPDGAYTAHCHLDHDGVVKESRPTISVTVTVSGDRLHVSCAGTDPAARGPINVPTIGSRSAVRAALKGLLAPLDATNHGHFLAIDFDPAPGLVVSAQRPSPCDSYGYVVVVLVELVIRALATAIPERCPAGSYQLFGVYFYRVDPRDGTPFIFIDPMDGGHGGRPHADGPSIIFMADGDTPNTPCEVLEARYPVLVDRYAFLPGTEGVGTHRGGMGLVRDFRLRESKIYLQCATENSEETLAKGMHGGGDGKPSVIVVWPGTERETRLQERLSFFGPLSANDVVSVQSGGGGGWGRSLARDPEQVARDVRDEFLTVEEAAVIYGVVVIQDDGQWVADPAATALLRAGSAG
jgi:N-methylhydantoinase B